MPAKIHGLARASLVAGPRSPIASAAAGVFAGIFVWSVATIGSALSPSYHILLFFRALVGVGEAPTARARTRCCAPTRRPGKRGRAMGIYNVGMALGARWGSAGRAARAQDRLAQRVLDRGRPLDAPGARRGLVAAPIARAAHQAAGLGLPAQPTYVLANSGGITATFGASALIFWTRWLVIEERQFSVNVGSLYMLFVWPRLRVGGVVAGGYAGDRLNNARRAATPSPSASRCCSPCRWDGRRCSRTLHVPFMFLTASRRSSSRLSTGPSAAVSTSSGRAVFGDAASLFLFGIHVLGNSPAPTIVGWFAEHSPVSSRC